MEHIVKTTLGKVRGYERDGMIEYLGIPYAKPPVGPLRFKRSVLHDVWNEVFDAKEYGPAPIQYNNGTVIGDEDCLTVNVQRPCEGEHLPVMIYIYGGGYNTGYSADEMYRGEAFARDGILFFSFNYRTNVLGFYDFTTYPGCEDFDSNCGLSDQILAPLPRHDLRRVGRRRFGDQYACVPGRERHFYTGDCTERASELRDDTSDRAREYRPVP